MTSCGGCFPRSASRDGLRTFFCATLCRCSCAHSAQRGHWGRFFGAALKEPSSKGCGGSCWGGPVLPGSGFAPVREGSEGEALSLGRAPVQASASAGYDRPGTPFSYLALNAYVRGTGERL